MYTRKEKQYIKDFCAAIGEIVFPEVLDRVEKTAMKEVKKFFAYPLTGTGRLIVGRTCNQSVINDLCENGDLSIGTVSEKDDGFEIKKLGEDIVIAGANSRGVLYGVYELEDKILEGKANEIDCMIVPYFRKRGGSLGHYHNIWTYNFQTDSFDDKKAEYLARMRINQFCPCFDGSPFGLNLSEFVHSDVFPFQREPSAEAVSKLKAVSQLMGEYGMETIMDFCIPALPEIYAPVELYPPEALGKVRRPWGENGKLEVETLCINSPIVQEHYRNVVGKFVREFPDVKGLVVYDMDGSAWICTPELCPRCAETLVDSDPSRFNPWETQAKLYTLISEAAHAVDPDYATIMVATCHFEGEQITKLLSTADDYSHLICGCMGGDHDTYVTHKEEPIFDVAETLKAAKAKNAGAYMQYTFSKHESIQTGFPNPFIVADSLKIFKRWGFDNIIEFTGATPALNQINALARRQFESEPDTDMESWLSWLAARQFGEAAGKKVYEVWEHTRDSFECWAEYVCNPLCGSQFLSRLSLAPSGHGAFNYGSGTPAITPSILEEFDFFFFETLCGVTPYLRPYFERHNTPEFVERYIEMEKHLAMAEDAAREAVALADDEFVGINYYSGGFEGLARHTRKEYAVANLAPIEIVHSMCKQKIHMVKAVHLLRKMKDGSPEEVPALQETYLKLIEDEIALQKEFKALLERLIHIRPTLALVGMCEDEIDIYIEQTDIRLAKLTEYLESAV